MSYLLSVTPVIVQAVFIKEFVAAKFDKLLDGNVYNASQGFCFASSG